MAFPLMAVIGLASAGVSAVSTIAGGMEQKRTAELEAKSTIAQRDIDKAAARERMAVMRDEYRANVSANEAFFSFAGRDSSDMSVRAFLAKQDKVASQDASAAARQMENVANARTLAAVTRQAQGQAAMGASLVRGLSTMASGIYNFMDTMPAPEANFGAPTSYAPTTSIRPMPRPL